MEFDVSKVYTAVNAEELPVGSKCYLSDRLRELKARVIAGEDVEILKAVLSDDNKYRFETVSSVYALAYLVELPKEKVVKPFETIEEAREVITAHGGFIKDKDSGYVYLVAGYSGGKDEPEVFLENQWHSLEHIVKYCVFADDDSPCGELVEE